MPKEFKLPDLGEGIHEGEIVQVLVSVGDKVEDGSPILLIETDKAETEVPSPVTGVVKEIKVKQGDIVNVGDVLMVFSEAGEAEEPAEEEKPPERPATKAEGLPRGLERGPVEERPEEERGERDRAAAEERERAEKERRPPAEEEKEEVERPREKPRADRPVPAAPSTRRLARELGVDLHDVSPSGAGGRVTSEDVRAFAEQREKPTEAPERPPARPPVEKEAVPPPFAEAAPLPDFSQWGPVQKQPLRSVRRAIAKRMAQSWAQIPHVSHADVADITELEAFRRKHKDEVQAQGGALSLTVFALKAAVAALKAFPRFNASLDTEHEEIIIKNYYHIGVAVDTERGLLVPTIRDVDRKSILELAKELSELIERARQGKVERDDMVGGTFTITNVGPLGGTGFMPIINYPQAAILGLAQAHFQPVVQGDDKDFEIVSRLMLPLILAFDHRIVDGADAARFMRVVINALHDPEQLLMVM
jgi:pyruvate dehydrogenase E2 component (dihydrolipoamide acetyltransferase)